MGKHGGARSRPNQDGRIDADWDGFANGGGRRGGEKQTHGRLSLFVRLLFSWGQSPSRTATRPSPQKTSVKGSEWQDSAGSLVLLAAAETTGLIQGLSECIRLDNLEKPDTRLANSQRTTRQQLVLTLLFMNLVGVQRTWDLRSYSG